jgi:hypothetical protein
MTAKHRHQKNLRATKLLLADLPSRSSQLDLEPFVTPACFSARKKKPRFRAASYFMLVEVGGSYQPLRFNRINAEISSSP